MLERRYELAACAGPDGKIYAVGGYAGGDNVCLDSAERYDPQSQQWVRIAPMKKARRALSLVAMPDGIYAIGGFTGKDYVSQVERYEILSDEWVTVRPMLSAKCTMSCVVSLPDYQYIYVLGGFNGQPLGEIERYDSNKEVWERIREDDGKTMKMLQKRFMHCSIVLIHD